jgi:hypothetical protein
LHLSLSSGPDGVAEVWQDGQKVIHGTGQNIPAGLAYNWIEVGITANPTGYSQVVYVDDLVISQFPL